MNLNFWTVDRLLSRVDLEETRPVIDLSEVTFFEPFGLVYLGMYLRHWNRLGKAFTISPPNTQEPRDYLARVNFWERFNFNPEVIEREKLRRFTSTTSLNDILDVENTPNVADQIIDDVLRVFRTEAVQVNSSKVAEVISELVDNFAQHSDGVLAACAMQYYPRMHRLAFAIGDCGIGIRESLAQNPKHAHLRGRPHNEAAHEAFKPLVSRKPEGGTGLTDVQETVVGEKGQLVLSTGDGFIRFSPTSATTTTKVEIGSMALDLPGVQVGISLPER